MKKFFFSSLMGLKKELLVGNGIWETTTPTDSNLATKWYLNLLNRKKNNDDFFFTFFLKMKLEMEFQKQLQLTRTWLQNDT